MVEPVGGRLQSFIVDMLCGCVTNRLLHSGLGTRLVRVDWYIPHISFDVDPEGFSDLLTYCISVLQTLSGLGTRPIEVRC